MLTLKKQTKLNPQPEKGDEAKGSNLSMARKRKQKLPSDPDGIFRGVSTFFVPHGVEPRRLQVWKQKLVQMGGRVQKTKGAKGSRLNFNHVLAADAKALLKELNAAWLHRFRGSMVSFEWLEESLKAGKRLPEHKFTINYEEEFKPKKAAGAGDKGLSNPTKRRKMKAEDHKGTSGQNVKKEMPTGEHRDTSTHVHEGSGVSENHKGTSGHDVKKEMPTGEHPDTSTYVHEGSGVSENHKGTIGHDVKKEMPTGERRDSSTHVHEGSGVKKEASSEEPTTYAPPEDH